MTPTTAPATGAADAAQTSTQQSGTAAATAARAKVIVLLGLPETATDAEIEGKITELITQAAAGADAQAQAVTAQSSLAEITAARDALRAQYEALYAKQQELDKAQREAEAEAALEPVKGRLTPEQIAKLRDLYVSSPDSAKFSLELMMTAAKEQEAAAAAPGQAGAGTPPAPVHDPSAGGATSAQTPEQKAAAGEALIKAIQGEGKFKDYSGAREEARRRKPELFN